MKFLLNGASIQLEPEARGLALHWLRERGLTGTKEGCGEGECGACTVLLGGPDGSYKAVASCLLPVAGLPGRHLVTVEGLNPPEGLTVVQRALVDAGAPQCGFCFPGIVMSLTAFLLTSDDLGPAAATTALDGNICRCTGYVSIRRAVADLCAEAESRLDGVADRVAALVEWGVLPGYFAELPDLPEVPEAGPSSGRPIAGGTDLIIQRPELLDGDDLHHLCRHGDAPAIRRDGDRLAIAGGVTVETLRHDPLFIDLLPKAPRHLERFASTIIRNRATVAGNLVNASPIGDLIILLLALEAELEISPGGRRLPLCDFYRGYKDLDLTPGEIVATVRVPASAGRLSYEKISSRRLLDIASVNSAMRARLEGGALVDPILAVGGVAPVPMLARRTMATLAGRPLDAALLHEAAEALAGEIAPIDDVRGSAAYKRELARRQLFAHVLEIAPDRVRLEDLI